MREEKTDITKGIKKKIGIGREEEGEGKLDKLEK